jgi:cell division transport system permease protein
MFWLNVKRIMRSGLINFLRNGTVSLSAVLVMIVTLLFIGSVVFTSGLLDFFLVSLKDKVDINIPFKNTAKIEEVEIIKNQIEKLPEVEKAELITAEQIYLEYRERNKDKQILIDVLPEIGSNPFGPMINVKAKQPSEYESVKTFLDQNYGSSGDSIIGDINYSDKKAAIDKLDQIIKTTDQVGAILAIVLILLAIFITLNTMRLAIYTSKDEIHVMKLVGADSSYITGPFLVTGAIYGALSAIIVIGLFFPITMWLSPKVSAIFFGFNLYSYFLGNFFWVILIVLGAGIGIGAVSSVIAVNRYLKDK